AADKPPKKLGKVIETLTSPTEQNAARPAAPASDAAHAAADTRPPSTLLATLPSHAATASASPGAAPALPSVAPAATTGPAGNAPPPPPAAPAPAASTGSPAAGAGADASLPQLTHAAIDRAASDHTRELSKCGDGEEVHGGITVRFTVDAAGKVIKAQVATAA